MKLRPFYCNRINKDVRILDCKLFDSELKIMEFLWENGEQSAREIAQYAAKTVGWSKTTTYTVLKKCVDKGAIERREPGFMCRALVSREEVRRAETEELIGRLYGGSADLLVASLLDGKRLTKEEIARLKERIRELE